jgi:hypothetical protein
MSKGYVPQEKQTLEKDHQRRDPHPSSNFGGYDFGERGFWCESCGAKCTLGLNKEEYGHYADCPHRNIERDPNNLKGEK